MWRVVDRYGPEAFQWPYFRIRQAVEWLDIKDELEHKAMNRK